MSLRKALADRDADEIIRIIDRAFPAAVAAAIAAHVADGSIAVLSERRTDGTFPKER